MPRPFFARDEELGKKDDEYRPGVSKPPGKAWIPRRLPHGPQRRTVKRAIWGIAALIALYFFYKGMPTDLKPATVRPHYDHPGDSPRKAPLGPRPPVNQGSIVKPGQAAQPAEDVHDFNGPIKFYQLASSLHAVSRAKGLDLVNRNVLFATASLKSAAILLPIACEMAIRERNYVHFALMGRDDISMDIMKSVNGIGKECNIMFHDARPDFSVHSTDFRMEVSSSAALNHINSYVHPQATFIDGSGEEELFFLRGVKDRAVRIGLTIIELPENAEKSLMWITLLNSASLKAWNKVTVDLVVHAQPSSSGSLMRLLESLKRADFFSSTPPRLTIELPHKIDEPTKRYLEQFKWPPTAGHNDGNLLTLHHRIPQQTLTPEENSIRFLESFWPADPHTSHVLVLSPQAELSPLFFHYLKYTMLEYKFSSDIIEDHDNLLGISLDLPPTYLNDTTAFTPPLTNGSEATPFLWQAPNSNAALYFGSKWIELHDFVAHLLTSQHKLPTPTTLNEKLVSNTYPSWLEHILKLARVRGYWMIYPNFDGHESLATMHNDLYQPPEEYEKESEGRREEGELTADPKEHLSLKHKEKEAITGSLLNLLPNEALLKVDEMPILRWDGEVVEVMDIESGAIEYKKVFRREIGGCSEDGKQNPEEVKSTEIVYGEVRDLFCLSSKQEGAREEA